MFNPVRAVAVLVAAVLLSTTNAALVTVSSSYCQPRAFKDYNLVVGYQAVVIVPAACKTFARLRKYNRLSHSAEPYFSYAPGTVNRVWLFTHDIQYTLDGQTWKKLDVKP